MAIIRTKRSTGTTAPGANALKNAELAYTMGTGTQGNGGERLFIGKDSNGSDIVMSRDAEIVVLDANKRERSKNKVPKGSRLLFKDGSKISKGDKLVEWDPYTRPIISEKSGIIKYGDLL